MKGIVRSPTGAWMLIVAVLEIVATGLGGDPPVATIGAAAKKQQLVVR